MAIPEGYQFLAKLGIVYKGDYDERVAYNQYDAVYYNGSTYIALMDSPVGPPTADGVNWQYMAQGFLSQVISSLTATDKNGVIGEAGATVNAQNLIDGMSDDIKDKLDKTGDASDTIVTFEQASERTNIISGESHKTILGKIKKWFADMTAAAFAQIITSNTDLMATTVAGYLADALAVKNQFDVVGNKIEEVNSNFEQKFIRTSVYVLEECKSNNDIPINIGIRNGYTPISVSFEENNNNEARNNCIIGSPIYSYNAYIVRIKNLANIDINIDGTLVVIWIKY